MMTCIGTEFNGLAKLLFGSISTLNPDFNPLSYLDTFESKKNNLERVNFVYNDIKKYPNVFAKFIKDQKDDELSFQHVESGKVKLNSGKYWAALEDFTRGVVTAESEKSLAVAYGYRSECFLKLNMPEKCIEETDRALGSYPKEVIDELMERKKEAESMEVSANKYYDSIPDCDTFDSSCVTTENNENGNRILAARDIEIGEIISIEAPSATVLTSDRLNHCHECLKLCYNPIPCSKCTVALFCNEICKNKAQPYHKYECAILLTICYRVLCEFATDNSMLLALKVALLSKDSPKMISRTKLTFSNLELFHQAILTALIFELLWNHTSFFSGIFSSVDSEDKFKENMLAYLQIAIDTPGIYEYLEKFDFNGTNNFGLGVYPRFALFNHSCCANVMKTYHGSTMVLRALNTIKKGEECFVNRYSLRYDVSSKFDRQQFLFTHTLPKCECKACQEDWVANSGDHREICENLNIDVMEVGDIVGNLIGSDVNKAEEFLPILIRQLKECEDSEPEGNALLLKSLIVHCYVLFGNKRIEDGEGPRRIGFLL